MDGVGASTRGEAGGWMRSAVFGAVAGLVGLLLNAFPIELLPAIHLLLGPVVVLFAATLWGPVAGGVAGGIASVLTIPLWGHPWAVIAFTLEGVVVGALRTRLRPVAADALWWIAGSLYLLVSYVVISGVELTTYWVILIKQVANALVAALMVQVLLTIPSLRRRLLPTLAAPMVRVPVRTVFGGALALGALMPLLIFGGLEGRARYERELARVDEENLSTARLVAAAAEQRLQYAVRDVQLLAGQFQDYLALNGSFPPKAEMEQSLQRLVAFAPELQNAYVGSAEGVALAFAPKVDAEGRPLAGLDFSDRPYFQKAREQQHPFVTDVFVGRGGARGPLAVAVAPMHVSNNFAGYVLAALDLEDLAQFASAYAGPEQTILMVDSQLNVVAGPKQGEHSLQTLQGTKLGTVLGTLDVPIATSYTADPSPLAAARAQSTRHLGVVRVDFVNWRVVVEQPTARLQQLIRASYLSLLAGLFAAVGALVLLSFGMAPLLVSPLRSVSVAAADLARGDRGSRVGEVAALAPRELADLGRGFDRMADELERQLETIEHQSRQKDDFLSIASHELKTPITALKAQLQLLQRGIEEGQRHRVQALTRQVDRLTRLVNQLLDASHVGQGRLPLERRRVDLGEIVRRVAEALVHASPQHTLELHVDRVEGDFDEDRTEQVVYNLVSNAVKYSPDGGPIEVWVSQIDGRAQIRVSDRGIGIGDVPQDALFGRFKRGETGAVRQIAGLGVGLYVSREIVRLHGGDIRLEPRVGGGTTAVVELALGEMV